MHWGTFHRSDMTSGCICKSRLLLLVRKPPSNPSAARAREASALLEKVPSKVAGSRAVMRTGAWATT